MSELHKSGFFSLFVNIFLTKFSYIIYAESIGEGRFTTQWIALLLQFLLPAQVIQVNVKNLKT